MSLPGGPPVPRQLFSWSWRVFSTLGSEVNQHGVLEWSDQVNYLHTAQVSKNGRSFISTVNSGPGVPIGRCRSGAGRADGMGRAPTGRATPVERHRRDSPGCEGRDRGQFDRVAPRASEYPGICTRHAPYWRRSLARFFRRRGQATTRWTGNGSRGMTSTASSRQTEGARELPQSRRSACS